MDGCVGAPLNGCNVNRLVVKDTNEKIRNVSTDASKMMMRRLVIQYVWPVDFGCLAVGAFDPYMARFGEFGS